MSEGGELGRLVPTLILLSFRDKSGQVGQKYFMGDQNNDQPCNGAPKRRLDPVLFRISNGSSLVPNCRNNGLVCLSSWCMQCEIVRLFPTAQPVGLM